ncbi:MAG TPA: carbohydrate ABC transporter permease [Candidatus Aerophobetes bacterium]|uniref:Carbohydrate ABC transporter permease n=1 Tax=Aerophobetes bacterium TaxID=2030807 RepID=A0A662DAI7_UNCAE|nr:MAG: carbohydrate ABC transporter permease [Candidatus Aerophobetes bacterium]HDN84343.1 carbohydrate ABC transporter permease [Candidatus Aerophobetes bacterium]
MKTKKIKQYTGSVLVYCALGIALFVALFPIAWTVSTSFKTVAEYYTYPPVWIPHMPTLENYKYIIYTAGLGYLKNSLIVSFINTILVLGVSIPAAYGIARFKIGRGNLSFWILSQRMFPPIAVIIPLFLLLKKFGLIDTYAGLVIVYCTFNIAFSVWLLTGFFEEFPRDIEEAAMVDGCSRNTALVRIVIPLVAPGIVVTGIFCFIFAWNEFMFALILTREAAKTVTVQLSSFQAPTSIMWGKMSALIIIAIVPILIMTMAVQKYLVRGLTLGAVKG